MIENETWDKKFLLRYSLCYIFFFLLSFFVLVLEGKSFIWSVDGLEITYPLFVFEGEWLRDIVQIAIGAEQSQIQMWSQNMGLGSDVLLMIGSNPFNVFSALFPKEYAEIGMAVVVFIELYIAGIGFSVYSCKRGNSSSATLAGAMVYVFSGWSIAAALRQHLFLVPIVLFPFVLAGIDKLFKKESPILFVVSIGFLFFSYFYFAYMACLALVPYCIYSYIRYVPEKSFRSLALWVVKVVGLILIAALIAGIALFPTVMNVLNQGRLKLDPVVPILYDLRYYVDYLQSFVSIGSVGMDAHIGYGALGYLSCVALFSHRKRRALKIAFIGATAMMLIPFFGHMFNGFSYVTNRWAWIYSFLIAYIVTATLPVLLSPSKHDQRILIASICVYAAVMTVFPDTKTAATYANIVLMFAIVAIVSLVSPNKTTEQSKNRGHKLALIALTAFSVALPCLFWISDAGSNWASAQVDAGKTYATHQNSAVSKTIRKIEDDSLWRYDTYGVPIIRNSNTLLDLRGFDYYTPFYDENVDQFLAGLDLATLRFSHYLTSLDRRSFIETALGVKYFVVNSKSLADVPFGYTAATAKEERVRKSSYSIFESKRAFPIAYFSPRLIADSEYYGLNAVQRQQEICRSIIVEDQYANESIANEPEFNDALVPFEIKEKSKGVKLSNNVISVPDNGGYIVLEFDAPAETESYLWLKSLTYSGNKPHREKGTGIPGLIKFIKDVYYWREPTAVHISFEASTGFETTLEFLTPFHHMYGAKNSALVNFGYNKAPITNAKITFEQGGTYSFDDISIVSQTMPNYNQINEMQQGSSANTEIVRNGFNVQANARQSGVLCLSVPWSLGWSAVVDGNPTSVIKTNTAFIGVPLEPGTHAVQLRYTSPRIKEGALLSLAGLIILTIVLVLRKIITSKRKNK